MSDGLRLLASLAENGSTSTMRNLHRDTMVDDDELLVFDFIRQHQTSYGELPAIETIEDETNVRLPDTPEVPDYYLQAVHRRSVYNQVRDVFPRLRDAVASTNIDQILTVSNTIRQACVPYTGQQQELYALSEIANELMRNYMHHHDNPGLSGIPTGWEYLDLETGGYQNGDFVVWVARPSVGKTWLLIHQALTALSHGKSVLFVSMEMTLVQIATRIAAHIANLNPDYVRKGTLSSYGEARLRRCMDIIEQATNFHLYAGNFNKTTQDIESLIHELNPDAIYIDGMYLMKPAHNGRMGRFEAAAYLMDEIKRMALMADRPVIATTQFGRGAGKGGKEGSLENIGYTDAIGTHASIVISAKLGKEQTEAIRDVVYDEETGDYTPRIIGYKKHTPYRHIEFLKGREGESGAFGTNFAFAPTNFTPVPLHIAIGEQEQAETPDLGFME